MINLFWEDDIFKKVGIDFISGYMIYLLKVNGDVDFLGDRNRANEDINYFSRGFENCIWSFFFRKYGIVGIFLGFVVVYFRMLD